MVQNVGQATDRSEARLDRAIMTARTVVLMLATSVLAYVMMGTVVVSAGASPEDVATYQVPLASIGFAALLGSVFYRRVSLTPLRLERAYLVGGEEGLAAHLMRSAIVSAVLGDAVGVAGLALGVM